MSRKKEKKIVLSELEPEERLKYEIAERTRTPRSGDGKRVEITVVEGDRKNRRNQNLRMKKERSTFVADLPIGATYYVKRALCTRRIRNQR